MSKRTLMLRVPVLYASIAVCALAQTPSITKITPSVIKPGNFNITVDGTGLTNKTVVYYEGRPLTTTFVSSAQVTAAGSATASEVGDVVVWAANPGAVSKPARLEVHTYTAPLVSLKDAHRFLRQTSWGPTPKTVDRVQAIGIPAFLDEQFTLPPSYFPVALMNQGGLEPTEEYMYRLTLAADDQLRQRVAWALHEIFVISGNKVGYPQAVVPYANLFQQRAFGNYYDVLKGVTLNPAMGVFLDMVNNKKQESPDAPLPNENYAREVLQLFSIGLAKLNQNGTPVLDSQGKTIPTYDQNAVINFTRAFTGWTYPDLRPGNPTDLNPAFYVGSMEPVQKYHDVSAKTLLNGAQLPPNQSAEQDLEGALQNIFQHPNVAPFICRQLILKLVTSNPSDAYIGRVAAVFNNNGSGVRGDLKAVVRAILLDPEAALGTSTSGHLREPALFIASQLRALNAKVSDYPFMSDMSSSMAQRIFHPASVFSYYSPFYRAPGTSLYGPEFQIYATDIAMTRANLTARVMNGYYGSSIAFDLPHWANAAYDPAFLTDMVNRAFMGEQMSSSMRTSVINAVTATNDKNSRAKLAIYLAVTSSQSQVEH